MCHKKYRSSCLPRYFFLSFFDAEQPAQNAAQTLWAFDNDHLHRSPAFRGVIPQYKRQDGKVCGSGLVPGQVGVSGTVSTTTSAPLRVEMVMQSEPSAYSLLTPSG